MLRMAVGLLLVAVNGCWRAADREVVIYSATDQDCAEPVLQRFEAGTGIHVRCKFDVESTKTVGLVNAILAEASRPRCDVFWNNEILHTLRLQRRGILETYHSPVGSRYPAVFRSSDGAWYGFGARVRVLIVNTERVSRDAWPTSVEDLIDPKWQDDTGIAKPLFGTTATHATVLFHNWGVDRAGEFFRQLKANAQVLSGNRQVAIAVSRGQLAWGLTDTDDAYQAQQDGFPVELVFPDQENAGALVIPNTIAIIKGSPHQAAAEELVDFLLRPETEEALARSRSAQFPLHPDSEQESPLGSLEKLRLMQVDFEAASQSWPQASECLRTLFQ